MFVCGGGEWELASDLKRAEVTVYLLLLHMVLQKVRERGVILYMYPVSRDLSSHGVLRDLCLQVMLHLP